MTCFLCLRSTSRFSHHKNYIPISGHHSFSLTHTHFLIYSKLLHRTIIMSPVQALPSFKLALHPDQYKTVLPNLSYPSRPITDIHWPGSSASLLFSVSQKEKFFVYCRSLTFLRKPRVQRCQSLLVLLMFKLVNTFFLDLVLTLTLKR